MEKDITWKWMQNKRKVGAAIFIPDKIYFKAIKREKEGHNNSTSGYLFEETQNTKSKRHI